MVRLSASHGVVGLVSFILGVSLVYLLLMANNEGGQLFGGNKPDVEVPEEAPVVEWNQDRTTLASLWVEKAVAFRDIARTVTPVSDRTAAYHSQNSHLYEWPYGLVVALLERQPSVKMMEIGLGCGMVWGPGGSIDLWKKNFRNTKLTLHLLEYDQTCAEKFADRVDKMFIGSQADEAFLLKCMEEGGGQYDLIIDDGSHQMEHQKISWKVLFPFIKPGGIYVIEDMSTSFEYVYSGAGYKSRSSTVEKVKGVVDWLNKKNAGEMSGDTKVQWESDHKAGLLDPELFDAILSMHCWQEVCAFVKKPHDDLRANIKL